MTITSLGPSSSEAINNNSSRMATANLEPSNSSEALVSNLARMAIANLEDPNNSNSLNRPAIANLDPDDNSGNIYLNGIALRHEHLPYWVLPTPTVIRYIAASLNRWIALIEMLGSMADIKPGLDIPWADQSIQISNGILSTAALRAIRIVVGSLSPQRMQDAWKREWTKKADTDDSDDETVRTFLGLDFQGAFKAVGFVAIRSDILIDTAPKFNPEIEDDLGLAHFGTILKASSIRTKTGLTANDLIFDRFRAQLEDIRDDVLHNRIDAKTKVERIGDAIYLAIYLVAKAYMEYLVEQLALRYAEFSNGGRRRSAASNRYKVFMRRAAAMSVYTRSLDYATVEKLMGEPPNLAAARPTAADEKRRNRGNKFAQYDMTLWRNKVWALFDWTDTTKRAWSNHPWRQTARRLASITEYVLEQQGLEVFTTIFREDISTCFWILPNYDNEHVLLDKCPKNQVTTSAFQWLKWVVPHITDPVMQHSTRLMETRRGLHSHLQRFYPKLSIDEATCAWKNDYEERINDIEGKLVLWTTEHGSACFPRTLNKFPIHHIFTQLRDFTQESEVITINSDSDDESSGNN
jgi:hypothetical protein